MSLPSDDSLVPSHFETCGVKIPLGGKKLPESIIVTHIVPESLRHFTTQRNEKRGFDVTIVIGENKINGHKALLYARIPFMRALFDSNRSDSTSGTIDLSSPIYDITTIESLINFAYTGTILISEDNVQLLIMGSNYFEMMSVMRECVKFVHNRLDPNNILPLLHFYRSFSYEKMNESVFRFIDTNFVPISHTRSFLELSINDLTSLLNRDSLHVDNENQIFDAVTRWLVNNPTWLNHGPSLLKCIRCPLLPISFLTETVEKTEWVMENGECRELVEKAKEYGLNRVHRSEIPFSNTERKCMDAPRLIVTFEPYSKGKGDNVTAVHIFNPIDATWTKAPCSSDIFGTTETVVIGSKVYFAGLDESLEEYYVFDTEKNEWRGEGPQRNCHWIDRASTGIATFGRKIIVTGGQDCGEYKDNVEILDTSIDNPVWTTVESMPHVCFAPEMCVLNGKIYAISGNVQQSEEDGLCYDPETNKWHSIAPRKKQLDHVSVAAYKGKIYVADRRWTGYVERYCPVSNTWTILNDMKSKEVCSLIVSCGKLFAINGIHEGDGYRGSMKMYDEERDTWEKVSMMPIRQKENDYIQQFHCSLPIPASFGCPVSILENKRLVSGESV